MKRVRLRPSLREPNFERYSSVAVRKRLLLVDDPLAAMQRLASSVRRHWGKRVIGITGSAGKTTTKEAIAQVLESRFKVHKSHGNLNNHFGLPLQLLRLQPEHEVAILEMGMSHAGEIAALCKIAAPDWGVVTNVGTAHAENFSDGQAGIARAKYELIASLPRLGTAILNSDDKYVRQFGRDFAGKTIYFGTEKLADPRVVSITPMGAEGTRFTVCADGHSGEVKLQLMGEHNVLQCAGWDCGRVGERNFIGRMCGRAGKVGRRRTSAGRRSRFAARR